MKATGELAKTDRIDAQILAGFAGSAGPKPSVIPGEGFKRSPSLEEETRFSIAGCVRPVGRIQGRLVQVVIRKLDQQLVAPLVAGQEAQPPHVLRPGRGGRLEEPVPDAVRPRLREVLDRTLQERPGHVVSPGARHEVEQIARVAGGVAAHLHPEHGVTKEGLPFPYAQDGHRRLGGARSVAPPQERRVLLRHARHARGDALEELVEGLVKPLEHFHPQAVEGYSGHERSIDRPKPPVAELCYRWGDRCWKSRYPRYVQQLRRMV